MAISRDKDQTDVGAAIIRGACNAASSEFAIEFSEIGIDAFLNEGVLKEIPILKGIMACRKTWTAIHDQLFLGKVAGFLLSCPRFTEAETAAFAREHLADPKKAKRLGNAIVLILGKLDDLDKPQMVAKAFAALVRRRIDYADFRRLGAGIDRAFVGDLNTLTARPPPPELNSEKFLALLEPAGFVSTGGGVSRLGAHGTRTDISPLGKLFQKCMWEE